MSPTCFLTSLIPSTPQAERDVLVDVEVREQRVALEHRVDVALVGRQAGDVAAAQVHGAVAGFLEPADHAERRGLPAARGAQHAEELALFDVERQIIDRGRIPEQLRHALQAYVDLRHVYPPP
jgi:hypothetical protein